MADSPAGRENVVFLAFSNPALEQDHVSLLGCRLCRNKTFKVIPHVDSQKFPAMHCAACDTFIGYFGWSDSDE